MGSTIGQVLGGAIGVAISPVPIIAVILMLFSNRANANGIGFLIGWILGLVGAGTIVLAIGLEASDGGPSDTIGWVKVAIGVVLFALGVKQWLGRPADGEEASMPGWMASIDGFNPATSLGLGFVLSALNPKNLGLTIAAVATIGSSGLESSEEFVVLLVFAGIASVTVAAPVVVNLVMGERAKAPLDTAKRWLTENNNTVMAVLFVVLGAKVLGDGIAIVA